MHEQYPPYRQDAYIRQLPDSSSPGQVYPGYAYPPVDITRPYHEIVQQPHVSPVPVQQPSASAAGGLFGGGRAGQMINDLQGLVNRMGGLDGILSTVGKIQKLMSTVQQITPMLGLLLKKPGDAGNLSTASADFHRRSSGRRRRARRRRRRAQRSGAARRTGGRRRSSGRTSPSGRTGRTRPLYP